MREISISVGSLSETCASPISTRALAPLTTTAVLRAELSSSLNHMRTWSGATGSTASLAGSDRSRIACARLMPGKRSTRQTAKRAAASKRRRTAMMRVWECMGLIWSSFKRFFLLLFLCIRCSVTLPAGSVPQASLVMIRFFYLCQAACPSLNNRWTRGRANQTVPPPKSVPVITRSAQVLSRQPNSCVVPSQAIGRISSSQ